MPLLRFGAFELDSTRRELRRSGCRLRLPPQPMTVLALLASRPAEVVTREELIRLLWPDGTFVDFDRGLNFCVNRIRRTLGEDARMPRYVETIPRLGYRFVATVTRVEDAPALAPALPAAAAPPPSAARRRWVALVASLSLALVAARDGEPRRALADAAQPPSGAGRLAYLRGVYEAAGSAPAPRSIASFSESVRLEPGSVPAWSALAQAWVRAAQEGSVPPREGLPRARAAAARAIALGGDAAAWRVLGTVALRQDWDLRTAERSLGRALALDPASAPAHLEMADLLLAAGRAGEAVHEAQRAEALDPVCPTVRGQVASSYYAARRFEEAAAAWRRSAQVAPELVGPHERLFHAYRHAAREGDAVREAGSALQILGIPAGRLLVEPAPQAIESFVRGTIEYLKRDAEREPSLVADRIAVLHAALGEREAALRWLDVAARAGSMTLPVTLATDPDLDALRADPAFRALAARLSSS